MLKRTLIVSFSTTTSKPSVLEIFKNMAKKVTSSSNQPPDPLTKTLLDEENKQQTGGKKTDHSRAIDRDNLTQHSHSHGNGEHHHGHSHDEKHETEKQLDKKEEDDDDFVEMWNPSAPAGPEHGGPRGLEPTRYSNEWEKNGRVKDFTV